MPLSVPVVQVFSEEGAADDLLKLSLYRSGRTALTVEGFDALSQPTDEDTVASTMRVICLIMNFKAESIRSIGLNRYAGAKELVPSGRTL